jgi:hypothetical protein
MLESIDIRILSTIIGVLLTFTLSVIYNTYNQRKQRLVSSRPFIETVQRTMPYKLTQDDLGRKGRMIITDDYLKMEKFFKKNPNYHVRCLTVENTGPHYALDVQIKIKCSNRNNDEWTFNCYIPIIKEEELILIPIDSYKYENTLVDKYIINYRTHFGEVLVNELVAKDNHKGGRKVQQSFYKKFLFFKLKIIKFNAKTSRWTYI